MMPFTVEPAHSPLSRFVHAVHRRQVLLCVLEHAALGVLGACAVAVVLVGVLVWRGEDAWTVAGVVLGVGAVIGVMWGVAERPTALAAVAKADRQLGTADLLATAWAVREGKQQAEPTDPFRAAVLALATARCGSLSPSAVLLRRFGVRAWGGVALAVAFVATLAALADRSPPAVAAAARDANIRPTAQPRELNRRPIVQLTANAGDGGPRRVEQNPAGDNREGGESPAARPDEPPAGARDPQSAPDNRALAGVSPGTGGGAARSQPPDSPSPPLPITAESDTPAPRRPQNGAPSAGAGRSAENPSLAQAAGGGTAGVQPSSTADAPWTRPDWANAAADALRAVQDGRVPDGYRDLVRAYFDPSAAGSGRSGTSGE